jgi:hypothetical protein
MAIDKNKFKTVTKLVIDKLEGGYFHPNMRTNNPTKFGSYHRSGETMFGLDRHAGHGIYYSTPRKKGADGKPIDVVSNLKYIESGAYEYKTPEAKEFWTTIDNANAKNNWKWLYRGGALENKLKDLAADIMFTVYERNAKNYLKEARDIVESDNRLLFHFIYGSWNGSGWFEKFAYDMNKAVRSGITDKDKLAEIALNSRTKEGLKVGEPPVKLIAQGGAKIANLFTSLKNMTISGVESTKEVVKKNPYKTAALTVAIILIGFVGYKLIKKNK